MPEKKIEDQQAYQRWETVLFCKENRNKRAKQKKKQAGAELGQAQLKLELGFTSTN